MRILNHHTWRKRGWRNFICTEKECGCERVWNSVVQRYIYTKRGRSTYSVPDCRFENEPTYIDFGKHK